jgi:archaellum biogenesis ATPase FlaH
MNDKEVMNVQMEKLFFTWILDHPTQFYKVEPSFFKNEDIQFIYKIVRDEYDLSKTKKVASPQQIVQMIKLHDPEEKISNNVIKAILKNDNTVHDSDWLENKFKAWRGSNLLRNNVYGAIELIRNLKEIDLENVSDVGSQLKAMMNNLQLIEDDDADLGADFDDPEMHKQDTAKNKISTGYGNQDLILHGGWDKGTFNVLMGETNVGKSMWLYNYACNAANQGRNVAVITVEMSQRKVMKRLGAMRLKIDVDQYDEISKDSTFIKNRINLLKNQGNGLFNTDNPGKIFVKKFNTGACTVTDIDNYLTKLEEAKGIDIDVVCLDYINLMSVDKLHKDIGTNLYMKGKHLAEGLRYIADKFNLALITATQVDRAVWGANDLKLQDIPESKAVAETADSVWGIIRNTEMKKHNKYRLKILKLRDGDHKEETILFDFHPHFLCIENDIMEESK